MPNSLKVKVGINDFTEAMQDILGSCESIVNAALDEATDAASEKAVDVLEQKSKSYGWKNYGKSFDYGKKPNSRKGEKVVFSEAPHYRLTHLLEFGHLTRNGGRTRAFPHWADAQKAAEESVASELKKAIERLL